MTYLKIFADKAELLEELSLEAKGELLDAMLAYAFTGEHQKLETEARFVWPAFRQMIDQSRDTLETKSASGKQGGRPRKQEKAAESTEKQEKAEETENAKNQESIDKNQDQDIDTSLPGGRERAKRVRFVPPTTGEVSAYCAEHSFAIDAQRFVDFYTSKGWRVGNQPMKDWRAAVRTWAQRDNEPARPRTGKVLHEQQYDQRAYTNDDDEMLRQMAEFSEMGGSRNGGDPDRGIPGGGKQIAQTPLYAL